MPDVDMTAERPIKPSREILSNQLVRRKHPVTIRRTIVSLLVAPLGAVAVTILGLVWDHGTLPLWLALTVPLLMLVAGWVVGLLIVLPIMVRWPLLRQPTKLKAAASAVLIAWMPEVLTRIRSGNWDQWQALLFVTLAGAAAGVLYSICAAGERQPATPEAAAAQGVHRDEHRPPIAY